MPFPPNFDRAWDETFPPDTQLANLLGQDIRNFKTDIRERLALLSGTFANRPANMDAVFGGAGYGIIYIATDTSQIFEWNGAAWVQITFNSNVTAKVDLTVQVANIPSTLLFTPAANGYFFFSAFSVITQAGGTGGTLPAVNITWTDADSGAAESAQMLASNPTNVVGSFGSASVSGINPHISIKGGTNINYSTTGYGSSGAPPMQYALHIRLEGPF